jgi:hypothetical protein
MNAIVIVFIPKEEPRAMTMAKRLQAQPETKIVELPQREKTSPLWTWFIENPRRQAA